MSNENLQKQFLEDAPQAVDSLANVQDLSDGGYKVIGIPIVFDYHHHSFNTGDLSEQQALELAISTWGGIVPAVHNS